MNYRDLSVTILLLGFIKTINQRNLQHFLIIITFKAFVALGLACKPSLIITGFQMIFHWFKPLLIRTIFSAAQFKMKNDAGSIKRFIFEWLVGFKLESEVCWVKIRQVQGGWTYDQLIDHSVALSSKQSRRPLGDPLRPRFATEESLFLIVHKENSL